MNALLLRFALFLATAVGITVLTMGHDVRAVAAAPTESTCALDSLALVAGEALEAREHRISHRQRPARWQTLLPGAFL